MVSGCGTEEVKDGPQPRKMKEKKQRLSQGANANLCVQNNEKHFLRQNGENWSVRDESDDSVHPTRRMLDILKE